MPGLGRELRMVGGLECELEEAGCGVWRELTALETACPTVREIGGLEQEIEEAAPVGDCEEAMRVGDCEEAMLESESGAPSKETRTSRRFAAWTLAATISGLAFVCVLTVMAATTFNGSDRATTEAQVVFAETKAAKPPGCCSWNRVDCGHGGAWCQSGPDACGKCKGTWGMFADVCTEGHPPEAPLPTLWRYRGKKDMKIKVMSYNLEWWATRGYGADKVIKASSKDRVYDFMGFQECEDPWHILWTGGFQHHYEAIRVIPSSAVAICIVWRNATWKLLSSGNQQVANDAKYGGRFAMWIRAQHIETKETVFFMNHHGPLPFNSGGTGEPPALVSTLLGLIVAHAKKTDVVVFVGDFNADGGSLTVRQLECKLSHVAWGDKYNGVDNVFANVHFSHVADGHGHTLYGGNSDHNALNVVIDLAPQKEDTDGEEKEEVAGNSTEEKNRAREEKRAKEEERAKEEKRTKEEKHAKEEKRTEEKSHAEKKSAAEKESEEEEEVDI